MTLEDALNSLIAYQPKDATSLVVMMCGIAGAGKTTFAQHLEETGFVRLSIDEEIWSSKGRYGIDYTPEQYSGFQQEAETLLRNRLFTLIQQRARAVVDFSFWQHSRRNEYKQIIEEQGGEWRLIYLKTSPDVLRQRLEIRAQRFDANAAFPITEAILDRYLNGFEEPLGQGEIVIEVT